MPIIVEKPIKAKDIRVGDEVVFPGNTYTELVGSVGPKLKYNHVDTDYGTTKISLEAEVIVFREELTEEEQAERRHRAAIEWITESREKAATRLEKSRERLISNLEMRDASWHGRHWASYAEAQIEAQLWNYVFEVAEKREVDLYAAILLVREDLTKRLIDYGNFLNRSSDQFNNYCTALESETRLKFLREIGWYVY